MDDRGRNGHAAMPCQAHGFLAFLDFQFGQAGLFQQFDQGFDFA